MADLFPNERPVRRAIAPTVTAWTCDVAVPPGIRETARELGARACRLIREQIVVVLADGRECWLNLRGEQIGHAPGGRKVELLDEVPWPLASVSERTRAA